MHVVRWLDESTISRIDWTVKYLDVGFTGQWFLKLHRIFIEILHYSLASFCSYNASASFIGITVGVLQRIERTSCTVQYSTLHVQYGNTEYGTIRYGTENMKRWRWKRSSLSPLSLIFSCTYHLSHTDTETIPS